MGGPIDPCIEAIRTRVPASGVASVEWPNEHDISKDPAWAPKLAAWGRDIYTKMKADPATRGIQVVGPWLVPRRPPARSATCLPTWMRATCTRTRVSCPARRRERMTSERLRMASVSGSKPLVATEAEVHSVLSATGSLRGHGRDRGGQLHRPSPSSSTSSAASSGRTSSSCRTTSATRPVSGVQLGLLRHDGTPRPAFTAVKNLMALVGTKGPSKLASLPYGISGDTSDLRHFAVAQADGSYLLFLWRTASVWNRDLKQRIAVPAKRLSLSLPTASAAAVGTPLAGTAMFPMAIDAASRRTWIDVAGVPLVVRVRTDGSTVATQ